MDGEESAYKDQHLDSNNRHWGTKMTDQNADAQDAQEAQEYLPPPPDPARCAGGGINTTRQIDDVPGR